MLLIPAFVMLVVYGDLGWALIVLLRRGRHRRARRADRAPDGARRRRSARGSTRWPTSCCSRAPSSCSTVPGTALVNRMPIWLTVLILSRDVAIVLTVAIVNLAIGRRTFRPSMLGKTATARLHRHVPGRDGLSTTSGRTSPIIDACVVTSALAHHGGLEPALHHARRPHHQP